MPRTLSPHSSLDVLRGEAKRWLKALAAEDAKALARFRQAFPDHTGAPKLREVQHALAHEYATTSATALRAASLPPACWRAILKLPMTASIRR